MAPTLHQEIGLRRGSDQEVSPPAVLPDGLEMPFSAALPCNVAGQQRTAAARFLRAPRRPRVDWMELSTIGLGVACAVLSVYRLFWAIQI